MSLFDHFSYLEERELIDSMIDAMEREYGAPIERVAKLDKHHDRYHITVVFSDFMILEAVCIVIEHYDELTVTIEGRYY